MDFIKAILNGCSSFMQYNINLFGYNINLFGVLVYSIVGYVLIYFWFRVMK